MNIKNSCLIFYKRRSDLDDVVLFPEYATKTASGKTASRWTQDAGLTRAAWTQDAGQTRSGRGRSAGRTRAHWTQDAGQTRARRG